MQFNDNTKSEQDVLPNFSKVYITEQMTSKIYAPRCVIVNVLIHGIILKIKDNLHWLQVTLRQSKQSPIQ
jgi:hypothetical protein